MSPQARGAIVWAPLADSGVTAEACATDEYEDSLLPVATAWATNPDNEWERALAQANDTDRLFVVAEAAALDADLGREVSAAQATDEDEYFERAVGFA